jgi:hypothetical protein
VPRELSSGDFPQRSKVFSTSRDHPPTATYGRIAARAAEAQTDLGSVLLKWQSHAGLDRRVMGCRGVRSVRRAGLRSQLDEAAAAPRGVDSNRDHVPRLAVRQRSPFGPTGGPRQPVCPGPEARPGPRPRIPTSAHAWAFRGSPASRPGAGGLRRPRSVGFEMAGATW